MKMIPSLKKFVWIFLLLFIQITPIWDLGNFEIIGFLGFMCLALSIRNLNIFYLSLTFFLGGVYRISAPDYLANIPALPFLVPALLSSFIFFFFHRASLVWAKLGKIDLASSGMIFTTGICSALALLLWASRANQFGAGQVMMKELSGVSLWTLCLVAVPVFAFVNAFAEEIVYRGIFQETLSDFSKSPLITIPIQGASFAAVHYHLGFPNGLVGYAMVLVYGVVLGFLRLRTKGLLAPYIAHVVADFTIGLFLVLKFSS